LIRSFVNSPLAPAFSPFSSPPPFFFFFFFALLLKHRPFWRRSRFAGNGNCDGRVSDFPYVSRGWPPVFWKASNVPLVRPSFPFLGLFLSFFFVPVQSLLFLTFTFLSWGSNRSGTGPTVKPLLHQVSPLLPPLFLYALLSAPPLTTPFCDFTEELACRGETPQFPPLNYWFLSLVRLGLSQPSLFSFPFPSLSPLFFFRRRPLSGFVLIRLLWSLANLFLCRSPLPPSLFFRPYEFCPSGSMCPFPVVLWGRTSTLNMNLTQTLEIGNESPSRKKFSCHAVGTSAACTSMYSSPSFPLFPLPYT